MTTEEKIIKIIGVAFNKDTTGLSIVDCVPERVEGWDSLGFLNLVNLLEDELCISFDLEDISAMSSGGEELLKTILKLTGI